MEPMTDQEAEQARLHLWVFLKRLEATPPCRATDAARAVLALFDHSGPWPTLGDFNALLSLLGDDLERSNASLRTDG